VPAAFFTINTKPSDSAALPMRALEKAKGGASKNQTDGELNVLDDDDEAFDMGFDFNEEEDNIFDETAVEEKSAKPRYSKSEQYAPDANAKAIYNCIGRSSLMNLTSLFAALERVVSKYKQHDKICILAYELCYFALKLDANSNPMTEILDGTGGHLLVPLQKEAINVLRAIFRMYPQHRAPIVQELFPLIAQVYSVKSGIYFIRL
jgi:hypothetical protein